MSSILYYFKYDRLPDHQGPLSRRIPSLAIAAANREVRRITVEANRPRKRGPYRKYTPVQRAEIGKYSSENGVMSTVRKFSKDHKGLNESTVRAFKKAYREKKNEMRPAGENVAVHELIPNKRGRPVIIGSTIDNMVHEYILSVRNAGGAVNTSIVIAGARGLLIILDRSKLAEYGGPATLNRGWAKSLLHTMKFTRRMGTTQAKMSPDDLREKRIEFLQNIVDIVKMEEIECELIFNWDQTGLNLVLSSNWTMERRGTKHIRIKGFKDKRMITGVFCGSMIGEFLPVQLIYGGKTKRCHPPQSFPSDWNITQNQKHWSNEETMLMYVEKIIVPFVIAARNRLNYGEEQTALAIFDCFKGQLTDKIVVALEDNNIHSVLVPANCTDYLPPLDLTVNKVAKSFLKQKFSEWYAKQVADQISNSTTQPEPVDLSTAQMKSVGVSWLIELYDHLCNNPLHVVNGFLSAGIPQSIDAGKPVLLDDNQDNEESDEEHDEESDEDNDEESDEDNDEESDEESEADI